MKNDKMRLSMLLNLGIVVLTAFLLNCCSCKEPRPVKKTVLSHDKEFVITDPSKGVKYYPKWAVFPDKAEEIRNITMKVTFSCPESLKCGEWDYSDRIVLERSGGEKTDSLGWELSRLITPYGWFFDGKWSFTWEEDVTDFSPVLRDSCLITFVHTGYEANTDRGWIVTVAFEFTTGKPAAEILSVTQIYNDHFVYGSAANPIESQIKPVSFTGHPEVSQARLRVIQTGHGMDRPDNCGEFCDRWRELYLDGELVQKRRMWKKCGENPLYPQAGTWIYDRANWCPGEIVNAENIDLQVRPAGKHTVNFVMEPYTAETENNGAQVISAYLVQYKEPRLKNDVTVRDIIVPSDKGLFSRKNPASYGAEAVIKNSGKNTVRSLKIDYGTEGFPFRTLDWKGELKFNETAAVKLPGEINSVRGKNDFTVKAYMSNSEIDEYDHDNDLTVRFTSPPVHSSPLVFYIRTNNKPEENSWMLLKEGLIVKQSEAGSLKPDAVIKDTLDLEPGAYRLILTDESGDGLEFWAHPESGGGEARLSDKDGNIIKLFEPDCGSGFSYDFKIGRDPEPADPELRQIRLYPRRTTGKIRLSYVSNKEYDVKVKIDSQETGKTVFEDNMGTTKEKEADYDMKGKPFGIYTFTVTGGNEELYKTRFRYSKPE